MLPNQPQEKHFDVQNLLIDMTKIHNLAQKFGYPNSASEFTIKMETLSELKDELGAILKAIQDSSELYSFQYQDIIKPSIQGTNSMSTNEVTNQNRKLKVSQSAELSTKPPDSKPKVQAKPSIPSHTQSHANLQKEIRHTKVSSHENTRVERSARNQVQPHKLDLWHNTEYLFGPLPSANDFEQAFSEMNLIQTLKDQPKVTCTEHWSNKFKDFVKKHKNMQPPPDPQIPFKQNSRFWEKNTVNFQVEECQRKKLSSLHHLLSAFVIIEEKEGENQENREKTTENRAGERLDNGEFQPGAHALIPRVKCENYYGFSFEERLEFELESLGLTVSDQRQIAPFDSEINFRLNQISLIEPKLDQYKKDILKNLEKFKRKREERIRNYQKSQEYLDSVLGNEC